MVFLYDCPLPGRCPADVAALQAIADAFPRDTACDAKSRHRIIIAPDSVMSSRFAAIAWGWSLKSECLDTAAFRAFLAAHCNRAPEDICGGGTDLTGSGWCVAPMGIRSRGVAGRNLGTPEGYVIWQGTLDRGGRIELEIITLGGSLLERLDLVPPNLARDGLLSITKHTGTAIPARGGWLGV